MCEQLILSTPTETLLNVIGSPKLHQADIARAYAVALGDWGSVDWTRVNQAIIERWSVAGLKRIKTLAWNGVEAKAVATAQASAVETGGEG